MKRHLILLLAAMVVIATVGCGGGGGGSTSTVKETWSANVATTTFGSQYLKTHELLVQWVGDKTGTNYGTCKVESVNKTSGTGTLSVNPDGSINLINDLPSDVFNFTFVTHHPMGTGDPDAGKILNGTASITIVPEGTSTFPTNFNIPQGGRMMLAAQAQNARATGGAEIVRVTKNDSRVPVNIEATWTINPPNAGKIEKNTDGTTTYIFTGAASYVGEFTLTAHIAGALDQPAAVKGNAIAHPTIGVSSPTEGQTVSGTITVQFIAQNATSVYWKVDAGAETLAASGNSFSLDTTALSNASHTLNFRVVGQLETVTLSRAFTVNNQVPYDPGKAGKLIFTGGTVNTNTDNSGKMVSTYYVFKTGGGVAVDKADTIRFFNAAGAVVNTVQTQDFGITCGVTADDQVWSGCQDYGDVKIYDKTGNLLNTLPVSGVRSVRYVPQTNRVLVCSNNGLREYNPANYTYVQLRTDTAAEATGDEKYVYYQGVGDGDIHGMTVWKLDRQTGAITSLFVGGNIYDLYCPPGYNCLVGTDKTSQTVKVWDKNGTLLSSTPLPNGEQVVGIGVDMSGDGSKLFITPDISLFQYRAQIVPN